MALLTGQNALRFSQYTADQFGGNGTTTIFTMSKNPPTAASLLVTIDGVKQHSSTYAISGTSLIFSEAPPAGTIIEAIALGNSGLAYELTDGVVSSSKIASSAVTSVKIADANVTTSKIADGNVTVSKLDTYSSNGTGAQDNASGTTLQRPSNPNNGTQRYNTTFRCVETYYNGFWLTADPTQQPTMPAGAHIWANMASTGYVDAIGKSWSARGEQTSDTSWTVPTGVYWIFVKMWGAGGGGGAYGGWRQGSSGGGGGYTQGLVPVTPGETITMRVGQRGYARWGSNRAYPDGGGASTGGGDNQYVGSGGGSTSIKVPSLSSEFCMFAGGGGGGGSVTGYAYNSGGAGGGIQGSPGARNNYTQSSGTNYGGGGQQTTGGRAGSGNNTTGGAGSFKQGGTHQNNNCYGGGGGGGWYGGGSGAYGGSSMGGGGGGSGYVHPSIYGVTMTGNGNNPANQDDPWLGRFIGQDDIIYARGGEDDGFGGPGLLIWWW
jgi:hypothetical protein